MSDLIDLHNPNYKKNLIDPSDTYRYDLELRIGYKSKIRSNGFGRDAGTAGFSKHQLQNIPIKAKPGTIDGGYDFYHPNSTIYKLISEDESPENFEMIIVGKNGTFIKAMLLNKQTNKYVFRTATYQTNLKVAKNYKTSHDSEYKVGKGIFIAGRGFWTRVQTYFNQN